MSCNYMCHVMHTGIQHACFVVILNFTAYLHENSATASIKSIHKQIITNLTSQWGRSATLSQWTRTTYISMKLCLLTDAKQNLFKPSTALRQGLTQIVSLGGAAMCCSFLGFLVKLLNLHQLHSCATAFRPWPFGTTIAIKRDHTKAACRSIEI